MIRGSINSIETLGLVDGPGVRVVVFLNGCKLRCKYCHNPEMWKMQDMNYSVEELVNKIVRYKSYFKDNGGVTFSGGEPLLQSEFLLEVVKLLKKENIHVAIDTAGVGDNYDELLELIDLVIFDVKHVDKIGYKELTGLDIRYSLGFIDKCNRLNKSMWVRQVIIPGVNDNTQYIKSLKEFVKCFSNVQKIEFLPYHTNGLLKYEELNIEYIYKDKKDMSKEKCNDLYEDFLMIE